MTVTDLRAILIGATLVLVAGCTAGTSPSSNPTPAATPSGSAAPGSATPDATVAERTGIDGTATAGPVCPVERIPPDPACAPRPVAGAVVEIRDASGKEVAQAVTAKDGTFRIDLAPGIYTVEAQAAAGFMGTAGPQTVTVTDGQVTAITLEYDTGIR